MQIKQGLGLSPMLWWQAAARRLLAHATRVELPHERSAAAAPPVHGPAAAGMQPGGAPGAWACTEPGIHAPLRVEPARGCVTTLEAIARYACRHRALGRWAARMRASLRSEGFRYYCRLRVVVALGVSDRCQSGCIQKCCCVLRPGS